MSSLLVQGSQAQQLPIPQAGGSILNLSTTAYIDVSGTDQFLQDDVFTVPPQQSANWASAPAWARINANSPTPEANVWVSSVPQSLGVVTASNLQTVTISSTSPPVGTVGFGYTYTFTASGGIPPYTWATTGGSLPPGLTLSIEGVISGTPTEQGTFTFSVKVADSSGTNTTLTFSITITAAEPNIQVVEANSGVGTVTLLGAPPGGQAWRIWGIQVDEKASSSTAVIQSTIYGVPFTLGSLNGTLQIPPTGIVLYYASSVTFTVSAGNATATILYDSIYVTIA